MVKLFRWIVFSLGVYVVIAIIAIAVVGWALTSMKP